MEGRELKKSWTNGRTDGHSGEFYTLSNAMHCIGQTIMVIITMMLMMLCSPLTRTSASCSMLPSSDDAMHVYLAVRRTSVNCSTFLPMGVGASGWLATEGTSTEPRRQRTYGMGEPTATHVRLTAPPSTTSLLSGRIEKCGGTRRTDAARKTTQLSLKQQTSSLLRFDGGIRV